MALANPSFESGAAGIPSSWTMTVQASLRTSAEFANGEAIESFEEGWSANETDEQTLSATTSAGFDSSVFVAPRNHDSFTYWDTLWIPGLGSRTAGSFNGNPLDLVEAFDEWLVGMTGTFEDQISASTPGLFDGAVAFDAFSAWDASWAASIPASTAAMFYGGSLAVDGFESVKLDQVFTVTPSTDTINATAHGFALNDRFRCHVGPDGGRLADGLNEGPAYYAVNIAADSLKAALVASGPGVSIDDYGFGVQLLKADVTLFWTIDFED
jgi:hypothetical protein